jgi:fused signal recognition particle receptor
VAFLDRWRGALARTRQGGLRRVAELVGVAPVLDPARRQELEDLFVAADVGPAAAQALVEGLAERLRPGADPLLCLAELVEEALGPAEALRRAPEDTPPTVWLLVGVNGSGKTTTAGKLAVAEGRAGRRVVLAGADTFRAAAADQLAVWAERAGATLVRGQPGADPAAVVYDALAAARARRADLVLVDTAGRLQTKEPLMAELSKIGRVIGRETPGGPHETLLVLDATFGLNAVSQARLFGEACRLSGLVLAKMDGTARGGAALAVRRAAGVPVKLVGVGEGVEDLLPFEPEGFSRALLGLGDGAA